MKICIGALIILSVAALASCVVASYPDDDNYYYSPYYDEYRGYPEYYWYNRPDYGYHRDRDRHERREGGEHGGHERH